MFPKIIQSQCVIRVHLANGSSIVVQSGEGAGSIAARAGISVDELERLNPDHMTSGYWYANPGDVVNVQ